MEKYAEKRLDSVNHAHGNHREYKSQPLTAYYDLEMATFGHFRNITSHRFYFTMLFPILGLPHIRRLRHPYGSPNSFIKENLK
jgi:hypothetical protein